MCFIVTVAIPSRHAALVMQMADRKFSIRTQSNDSIAKYFDKRATFVVMLGGCSCDLYAAETTVARQLL